ncbi:MFS transporter [Phenylobacterium sp.]|uniref:MFS transporter n=1 Tax=Phenylobacterium sp. TaxID=1871053 RepID=UPI00272F5F44|nr:MFS transporter [Phenylobacterium sp.]MDP1617505.1 MFS transporter [Phenylobacterium sp.]MDP1987011.1 MFS transporter [Phenylobacterium sp.]
MTASAVRPPRKKLSLPTKLFYGFGTVAFGVKDQGFSYLLLIFYNQVIGLPAHLVGLVIMIAMIFDAISDPLIGQVSDNWRSKWGRRHPFMYAAALPVAITYGLLWNPPELSQTGMFFYLLAVAVMIRTFITLYEIPSTALAAELTTDYDERTKVLSYRYFFAWWGGLTMVLLAFQVFLRPTAEYPVGQLNRDGYVTYGLVAAGIMLFAILVSAIGTHRHIPDLVTPPQRKLTFGQVMKEMAGTLSNRSFLVLIMAGLFNAMAGGLTLSLNLYFNTYFWELSAAEISLFAIGNFISAALAFGLAAPLSKRMGKKGAAQLTKVAAFFIGAAPITLRLLGVFPDNGEPIVVPLLFLQTTLSTGLSITAAILISSMIADVVEDSELKTGRRSEGLFFAAASFVNKAVSGIGIFASSMILLAIAFPQNAQPGQVPEEVIFNLGLLYVPLLGLLYAAAIAFVAFYAITRDKHEASVRQLASEAGADGIETPGPQ